MTFPFTLSTTSSRFLNVADSLVSKSGQGSAPSYFLQSFFCSFYSSVRPASYSIEMVRSSSCKETTACSSVKHHYIYPFHLHLSSIQQKCPHNHRSYLTSNNPKKGRREEVEEAEKKEEQPKTETSEENKNKSFFAKLDEQRRIHEGQVTFPLPPSENGSREVSSVSPVSSARMVASEMDPKLLKELSQMGPLTKLPRLSSKVPGGERNEGEEENQEEGIDIPISEGRVVPTKHEIEQVFKNKKVGPAEDMAGFTVEEMHYLLCSYKEEGYRFDQETLKRLKEHHNIESVQEIVNILEYVREPYTFEKDGTSYALWSRSDASDTNFDF